MMKFHFVVVAVQDPLSSHSSILGQPNHDLLFRGIPANDAAKAPLRPFSRANLKARGREGSRKRRSNLARESLKKLAAFALS